MILPLFVAVAVAEVVAVAADWTAVQWVAKPLLGPLLIAYMFQRGQRDLVTVALGFATAGDIALLVPGQTAFLAGMGFFLGAQACFLVAFLRRRPPQRWAFAGYGVLWALANILLWERLGALRVPVLIYSLALTAMAAAAAGLSRRVAAGGLLFLVSDLLIGLGAAGIRPPAHGVLVMTTYAAALALITTGWVRRR
ncbi:lysoplasmalogenase [Actinoplanes sp. NEAU-A12]|uniref:Lysoplasmalogenase n=1 Tax=Actinoplanes sandaracinus TaxID=3045177 RepID=A0ABT6WXI2_9ACTN|nr:lysoplasmalogenase [Actinoplanes sandaracinus]MDI6104404.1 lysoplasmalogenase [Actinoplanes sandaracinus]